MATHESFAKTQILSRGPVKMTRLEWQVGQRPDKGLPSLLYLTITPNYR
jgi:hypothetical protein